MSRGIIIEPDENGLYGGVVIYGPDGITPISSTNPLNVSLTGSNVTDGNTNPQITPELYNGSTWDRVRNNTQGTLLASAARTATTISTAQTNYNARGIEVQLNVTAASGTGGLTLRLRSNAIATSPQSDVEFLVAPVAITANGTYSYVLYPGVSGGTAGTGKVQSTVSLPLPRTFYVVVSAGDASSYTYEVDYKLIN